MKKATAQMKNRGGRPPKFREARRPVTMTLPERTLEALGRIDADRARAIVKAVDAVVPPSDAGTRVELAIVAPHVGVLLVPPVKSLMGIPWLKLIEVAPRRNLVSIVPGTPVERIELTLMDLLAKAGATQSADGVVIEALLKHVGRLRRADKLSKAEILFVTTP